MKLRERFRRWLRLRRPPPDRRRPDAADRTGDPGRAARTEQPRRRLQRGRSGTVEGNGVRIEADPAVLVVKIEWRTFRGPEWRVRTRVRWDDVTHIAFCTDRHDPVPSLRVWGSAPGSRRHILDSGGLTAAGWAELSAQVAASTGGRLRFDPAGRGRGCPGPDW
ncbi:hypothetical protein [Nocardiopsis coralliicola]